MTGISGRTGERCPVTPLLIVVNPAFTRTVYPQVIPGMQEKAAGLLSDLILGTIPDRGRARVLGATSTPASRGQGCGEGSDEFVDEVGCGPLEGSRFIGEECAHGAEHAPSDPPCDVPECEVGQCRLEVGAERVGDRGEVGCDGGGDEVAGAGVDRADQPGAPGDWL